MIKIAKFDISCFASVINVFSVEVKSKMSDFIPALRERVSLIKWQFVRTTSTRPYEQRKPNKWRNITKGNIECSVKLICEKWAIRINYTGINWRSISNKVIFFMIYQYYDTGGRSF